MTKREADEERLKPGPKPERGSTSKMVGVRLTDDERATYEKAARGMKLAAWIRAACEFALEESTRFAAFIKRRRKG